MKNLSATIKGFDYKGFFLRHGEKIGIGLAGLIVAVCLGFTDWSSSFAITPQEMQDKAQKQETSLRSNPWPEKAKEEFSPVNHEYAVARITNPIDGTAYSHGVPTSPKLYNYRQPADEPEILAVVDLRGASGRMPMAVYTTEADDAAAEAQAKIDAKKKEKEAAKTNSRGGGRGGRGGGGSSYEEMMNLQMRGGEGEGYGAFMGGPALANSKARGQRYNVITGVVPRRKQLDAYQKAMHLESVGDAPEHLNYLEFKLERQRAVPGPNPWPNDEGSWVPVNLALGIELFSNEVADLDPDVVEAKYINGNITSPLPHRLDGDWTSAEVGHPKIPSLDDAGRKAETIKNAAAAEVVGDEEDDQPRGPSGFGRVQRDPSKLRARAQARGGAGGGQGGSAYMLAMQAMMRGIQGEETDGGERRGGGAGYAEAMARMMGSMGGMNDDGYGGQRMVIDTGADMLLFRCFDFEVEPGEAYRYRVKLVVDNPSYQVDYVSSADVREGRDRASTWSVPSPPVIVPRDDALNLARVKRNAARRDVVELGVVQFDADVGTLISDTLKNLHYGEFVAEPGKTSMRFNPSVPSLKEEKVNFVTKDILIDSTGVPPLSGAAEQDLKLKSKDLAKLLDRLETAIVMDRFGELTTLDADTEKDFSAAKKRFEEQNEKQEKLKASATPMARGGAGPEDGGAYLLQMKTRKGGGSPLKANRRGGAGADPGARGGGRR